MFSLGENKPSPRQDQDDLLFSVDKLCIVIDSDNMAM